MLMSLIRAGLPMVFVFLLEVGANTPLGLYDVWPGLNILMHVLGGFVAAWSTYRFFKILDGRKKILSYGWPFVLWCFSFIGASAIFGILWEVMEFAIDPFVDMVMQPSIADTIGDLANDLTGGVLFCTVLFVAHKNKKI